jgi:nucleoside-diphosphate-sugar epimerase
MKPGKRVLVTGAGGFIGRSAVPALLRLGYEVHAVVSSRHQRSAPAELAGAVLHYADLLDNDAVDRLAASAAATHLLHFAWIATPGVYWNSEDNFRWLAASQHLLQAFHRHGGGRAVMAGSCAEYDWANVAVCDEMSSPLANASTGNLPAYTACKIALQSALTDFAHRNGTSIAWGRIFFQFGPYEHMDRLVPSVIRNLLLNREALCSHGRQVRSFLHVADVGSAFAAILDSQVKGAVNVGSDERISLAELIGRIARHIGRSELVRLGARPAPHEPELLVPVILRLRDEVGWRPLFTLDAAIGNVIDWWRHRLEANPRQLLL